MALEMHAKGTRLGARRYMLKLGVKNLSLFSNGQHINRG